MYTNRYHPWVALLSLLIVFSCGGNKEDSHDHGHDHDHTSDESVWKEMDDFHMIMAETFHPYKDSSNLEPAKTRASELLTAADAWVAAPLPEKVDSQEVKEKLQQLKSEAATLAESVRSSDDNVIAENLTQLHDTFHAIQEEWYGH